MKITVDESKCTNCKVCELVCSAKHEGLYIPSLSRIKKYVKGLPEETFTTICQQCENPPCMEACPVKAIIIDEQTNIIYVDNNTCIGCRKCVSACKFDAIKVNNENRKAYMCNLCNGEPSCIPRCPADAIILSN